MRVGRGVHGRREPPGTPVLLPCALVTWGGVRGHSPAGRAPLVGSRRGVPVAIDDTKQLDGGDEPRNHVQRALKRTVPVALVVNTIAIYRYATTGCDPDDVEAAHAIARGVEITPTLGLRHLRQDLSCDYPSALSGLTESWSPNETSLSSTCLGGRRSIGEKVESTFDTRRVS